MISLKDVHCFESSGVSLSKSKFAKKNSSLTPDLAWLEGRVPKLLLQGSNPDVHLVPPPLYGVSTLAAWHGLAWMPLSLLLRDTYGNGNGNHLVPAGATVRASVHKRCDERERERLNFLRVSTGSLFMQCQVISFKMSALIFINLPVWNLTCP